MVFAILFQVKNLKLIHVLIFGELDMKVVIFYNSLQLPPGKKSFLWSERETGNDASKDQVLVTYNCQTLHESAYPHY